MRVAWIGLAVVAFVLLMVYGVAHASPVSAALSAAGCRDADDTPEYSINSVGLTIVGRPCFTSEGFRLGAERSADLMRTVAWRSPAERIDSLRIAICDGGNPQPSLRGCMIRTSSHAELQAEFGPRDRSLDRRDWMNDGVTTTGFLLLPVFLLAGVAMSVWAGVRSARSGIVIVRLPR